MLKINKKITIYLILIPFAGRGFNSPFSLLNKNILASFVACEIELLSSSFIIFNFS